MDKADREIEALAYSRFIHAVATAVVIMEVTGGAVSSNRFLRLLQKHQDFAPLNLDDVLFVVNSDGALREKIADFSQALDAVRPLVLRAIENEDSA